MLHPSLHGRIYGVSRQVAPTLLPAATKPSTNRSGFMQRYSGSSRDLVIILAIVDQAKKIFPV